MVFLVKLMLALAAFEQLLPVFVFLSWARADILLEASIAVFSSFIFVSCALVIKSLWLTASDAGKFIPSYLSCLIFLSSNLVAQ